MKCSNKNCSNDAMSGKDPITISVGQVACCEYCKEQTDLQNMYEEEHDYFDHCKGLDLDFEIKECKGIGIKQYLEQNIQPTYSTLTKEKLESWVSDMTDDKISSNNT